MTNTEKQKIRELQATLIKIDNKQHVFFNIVKFENMGLIVTKKAWAKDAQGNDVVSGHTYELTLKGQMIKNTMI